MIKEEAKHFSEVLEAYSEEKEIEVRQVSNNANTEFDKWFNSLSEKEQKEYFEDQEADYWISQAKEL